MSETYKMLQMRLLILIIVLLAWVSQVRAQSEVSVTYIANEGVLISAGEDQVLIDALHEPYRPAYLPTPEAIKAGILNAEKPFDSVDFVLVSHVHRDHFDARLVSELLKQNSEPVLFSSNQIVDSVNVHTGELIDASRMLRIPYEDGKMETASRSGVTVKAGKVAHGSARFAWIQNLGYVVDMGGLKFLHIGDPGFGRPDLVRLLADVDQIDVAILPSWFITEAGGRKVIDEVIKPDHIIAVHVSPNDKSVVERAARRHYSGSHVFTNPMDEVRFASQ